MLNKIIFKLLWVRVSGYIIYYKYIYLYKYQIYSWLLHVIQKNYLPSPPTFIFFWRVRGNKYWIISWDARKQNISWTKHKNNFSTKNVAVDVTQLLLDNFFYQKLFWHWNLNSLNSLEMNIEVPEMQIVQLVPFHLTKEEFFAATTPYSKEWTTTYQQINQMLTVLLWWFV